MKYPKRGCISKNGKYYTHTDGGVHMFLYKNSDGLKCVCKLPCYVGHVCNNVPLTCTHWKIIEGAYVPSDEELIACDMAREMIYRCAAFRYELKMGKEDNPCFNCLYSKDKSCPARKYIGSKKQPDAWG